MLPQESPFSGGHREYGHRGHSDDRNETEPRILKQAPWMADLPLRDDRDSIASAHQLRSGPPGQASAHRLSTRPTAGPPSDVCPCHVRLEGRRGPSPDGRVGWNAEDQGPGTDDRREQPRNRPPRGPPASALRGHADGLARLLADAANGALSPERARPASMPSRPTTPRSRPSPAGGSARCFPSGRTTSSARSPSATWLAATCSSSTS